MSTHNKKKTNLFDLLDKKKPSLEREDSYISVANASAAIDLTLRPTRRIKLVGIYGKCNDNGTNTQVDCEVTFTQTNPSTSFNSSSINITYTTGNAIDNIALAFGPSASMHDTNLILEPGVTYRLTVSTLTAAPYTIAGYMRFRELEA